MNPKRTASVLVAFLHRAGSTTPDFHRCLRNLLVRDAYRFPGRVVGVIDRESSANVSIGRCDVVRQFLERDADWLLMLDDDMTFADDLLDVLLSAADVVDRPIVGGLCFGFRPVKGPDGAEIFNAVGGGPKEAFPTIYTLGGDGRMVHHFDYPRDAVFRVGSTGAACLLVHRRVFEADEWTADGHPLPWFREAVFDGRPMSEDQRFCLTAWSYGFPVHVHSGARTGHVKVTVIDEDWFESNKAQTVPWPPAVDAVDVIVPVLHRPKNVDPLMVSLRASTGLATAWFVVDDGDLVEAAEVERCGGRVLWCSGSFATKVNFAYRVTSAPWMLLVGDDVTFRAGWLDAALARSPKAVIGTNDLGNRQVLCGEHATHPLISRRYVDELGASWDGPGVVCHEGYGHMFVDNEIVTVAKQRNEFVVALDSVVEHRHPLFGKAADDAVYVKGRETFDADRQLFEKRWASHAR